MGHVPIRQPTDRPRHIYDVVRGQKNGKSAGSSAPIAVLRPTFDQPRPWVHLDVRQIRQKILLELGLSDRNFA